MKGIKKIILLLVMLLPLTLTLGVLSAFADGMQQGGQAQTTDRTFAFTQEELDGKTFLFFGDSITAGYGLSATELDYVEILSDEFGFEAHNKAVSGATWTVDAVGNDVNNIFTQLENNQTLVQNADYISIMLGTNDYGWGLRPLGAVTDNPQTVSSATTVYGAIRLTLSMITQANPDVKMMLMTPPLWPYWGYDIANSQGVTMGDVREAVKTVGKEFGCKIIDNTNAIPSYSGYYSDEVHLKQSGYYLLADYIKNYGKNVETDSGAELITYYAFDDETAHTSEKLVFSACDDAISEIKNMVRIICNEFGGTRVLITSDHGFLYTAKPLQENDKVDRSDFGGKEVEYARRYAIMQKGASPEYLMPIKFLDGTQCSIT